MRAPLLSLTLVALSAACSEAPPANPTGADGGGGASVTAPGATTATAGGAPMARERTISIVMGEDAGEAPGAVWMTNASDVIVTLQVGEASFWQLAAGTPGQLQYAASDSIGEDMRIGYHESESNVAPCVFLSDYTYAGPEVLAPRQGHRFRVTGPDPENLTITVEEEVPPPPFFGLRGLVEFSAAQMTLTVDFDDGESADMLLLSQAYGPFTVVDGTERTTRALHFTDSGGSYTAELAVPLGDAPGYTFVIGDASVVDAIASAPLQADSP